MEAMLGVPQEPSTVVSKQNSTNSGKNAAFDAQRKPL